LIHFYKRTKMARDVGTVRSEGSNRSVNPSRSVDPNRSIDPTDLNYGRPIRELSPDGDYSTSDSEREQRAEEYSDEEEGEELYRQFLQSRLRQNNLPADFNYRIQDPLQSDLASLAERFTRSHGREQVREKAEELDLSELSADNFNSLLAELFHDGGVTQERLLVLFFFCSDLTIRAARAGLESLCERITSWTLSFIRSTVMLWVRVHGGWARVLRGSGSYTDSLLLVGSVTLLLSILYIAFKRT